MVELLLQNSTIILADSDILFKDDFSDSNALKEWLSVGDISSKINTGALEIKHQEDGELDHGQLFTRQRFSGDILMEFTAATIPPSDHDIIWWLGVKLNKEKSSWDHGYLGALGGWWSNQAGLEKIEGKNVYMLKTPLFKLIPGKEYKIQCGMINETAFFFVDGQLIIEFIDSDPLIKKSPGHIGFGVYQSHIRIKNLKVYKIKPLSHVIN